MIYLYKFDTGDRMNYSLNAGEWNSVFAIPTSVVDKYIKLASAGSLKLLLFLMRHGGKSFTDVQLRDALGFRREGELEDAALFWVQRGIITADGSSLTAASDELPAQIVLPEVGEIPEKKTSTKAVTEKAAMIYTPADIADRINTDKAIAFLFSEAQALYGRLLKHPESRCILMLVDHYGLPAEVAALLLKYCFKIGKKSTGYIESVAQSWSDEGIHTASEADALLSKLEQRFSAEEKLREEMELTTKFSPNQSAYIKTWTDDWEFTTEMIIHAYYITVDQTGKAKFSYMNTILERWKNAGIRTKEAAIKDSQEYRNKQSKPACRDDGNSSIDMGDIMSDVMNQYFDK